MRIKSRSSACNSSTVKRTHADISGTSRYTDHIKPMVLLTLNTGLRRGELFSLKWNDVELDENPCVVVYSRKSKKSRTIWLNTEAECVLKQWWEQCPAKMPNDYVFTSTFGGQSRLDDVRKLNFSSYIRGMLLMRWTAPTRRHRNVPILVGYRNPRESGYG